MCHLLPCKTSEDRQIPFPAGGAELCWLLSGTNPPAGPESWYLGNQLQADGATGVTEQTDTSS